MYATLKFSDQSRDRDLLSFFKVFKDFSPSIEVKYFHIELSFVFKNSYLAAS